MPLGRLPWEVFLAHKSAWIRPWICWRNFISHLAREHLEILPQSEIVALMTQTTDEDETRYIRQATL